MPEENAPTSLPVSKEKTDQIKNKLEKFKKELLNKFDKYVLGIALLPPEKEKDKNLDVFIVIDDSDSKGLEKLGLRDKLFSVIEKIAKDIDDNIKPDVLLKNELVENFYDGKYKLLELISSSLIVYDPADMLAALMISEVHKTMVLKKFDKYIVSYIAAGSLFRGEKSHDIDVYIIVDDTDVKKMSRYELKDKLRAIIIQMGYQASDITRVKKAFHIQV